MLKLKEEALFNKFLGIWGQKWAKSLEDARAREAAQKEWEIVFKRLTDEQVLKAIDQCKLTGEFPPSISEFLCAGLEIPSFHSIMYSDSLKNNFFCYILFAHYISKQEFMEDKYKAKDVYEALKEDLLLDQNDEINSYKEEFISELQERERKTLKEGREEQFLWFMCEGGNHEHLAKESAMEWLTETLGKYGARKVETVLKLLEREDVINPIWRFKFLLNQIQKQEE